MAKKRRRRAWTKLPLEKLLDVRLCELDVQIKRSVVEQRIEQVLAELQRREITFLGVRRLVYAGRCLRLRGALLLAAPSTEPSGTQTNAGSGRSRKIGVY